MGLGIMDLGLKRLWRRLALGALGVWCCALRARGRCALMHWLRAQLALLAKSGMKLEP